MPPFNPPKDQTSSTFLISDDAVLLADLFREIIYS